jgi:hypothetical protein
MVISCFAFSQLILISSGTCEINDLSMSEPNMHENTTFSQVHMNGVSPLILWFELISNKVETGESAIKC